MLPSSGSQYKEIASNQKIGEAIKKVTPKLVKGIAKAKKLQGQYKTAVYAELRKPIRENKARYEASQARQKESLDARELKEYKEAANTRPERAKTPEARQRVQESKKRVAGQQRIREITKNLKSGYSNTPASAPKPPAAGPSVSMAQTKPKVIKGK